MWSLQFMFKTKYCIYKAKGKRDIWTKYYIIFSLYKRYKMLKSKVWPLFIKYFKSEHFFVKTLDRSCCWYTTILLSFHLLFDFYLLNVCTISSFVISLQTKSEELISHLVYPFVDLSVSLSVCPGALYTNLLLNLSEYLWDFTQL